MYNIYLIRVKLAFYRKVKKKKNRNKQKVLEILKKTIVWNSYLVNYIDFLTKNIIMDLHKISYQNNQ